MENIKGTQTEKNLQNALQTEVYAVVTYELFGNQARKDGYNQIQNIFNETAENEKTHATLWLKWLSSPDDHLAPTTENLKTAIGEEDYAGNTMYPEYAKVAREEGFELIAQELEGVGKVELSHEARFKKLLKNIEDSDVFERPEPVMWQCLKCGHLQVSKAAPEKCPVCQHPQAYFQIYCENY